MCHVLTPGIYRNACKGFTINCSYIENTSAQVNCCLSLGLLREHFCPHYVCG